MGQRLGIASALLADPDVLLLDEPVNGLDPDGVRWIRNLLRGFADEGRTVFLSSHLMSEMALTADHVIVIVIGRGRLLRDQSMADFIASAGATKVRVRSPEAARLADILRRHATTIDVIAEGVLDIEGMTSDDIGIAAAGAQVTLFELTTQAGSLEAAYMVLTEQIVDFHTHTVHDRDHQ